MTDAPTTPAPSGPTFTPDGQVLGVAPWTPAAAEAATAELAARTAAYQARNAPPAPDQAGPAGSPEFARARLAQINSDPQLQEALLKGQPALTREWHELNRIVVAAGDAAPGPVVVTSGQELSPLERETAFDGLRQSGDLPVESEQYIRELDAGTRTDRPTQGDAVLAREARDRYFRDAENRQKYLNGGLQQKRIMSAFNRVVALAEQDGKPATAEMHTFLQQLGLR
jgi:hypothetical protein